MGGVFGKRKTSPLFFYNRFSGCGSKQETQVCVCFHPVVWDDIFYKMVRLILLFFQCV